MNPRLRHALTLAVAIGIAATPLLFWNARRKPPEAPPPATTQVPEGHEPSLLEQMGVNSKDASGKDGDAGGPVATNEALERQYAIVQQNQRDVDNVKRSAARLARDKKSAEMQARLAQGKQLVDLLNVRLAAFQKDLTAARKARPDDPVVQWLTAELLIAVGGEPDEIIPYLQRAGKSGLKRPQLSASLAKVEIDLNHFQAAYGHAADALAQSPKDPAYWNTYVRAAFGLERFEEVAKRVLLEFPDVNPPDWTRPVLLDARRLQALWSREQRERDKEDVAGNLPLVRMTIEHRAFEGTNIKVTGTGQVEILLYEDQAPATVANFIHLVETGFYDGTLFYWSEAGHMVVGGDPNTKNADPNDDGLGGPGYAIPDEFAAPNARMHARGTISTVQNGPRRAGSQFFISLILSPEFDGSTTAFGRVVKGQDVVDRITQGRTNRQVGQFGRIIPGDRIVRATVLRKRPHPYTVTKVN